MKVLPWGWYQNSGQIADSHRQKNTVGRRLHAGSAEDDDDDCVGNDCDQGEERHNYSKQWLDKVKRSQVDRHVQRVAGVSLKTTKT